jgi:cobyrinic acid a,c-diamide synthase
MPYFYLSAAHKSSGKTTLSIGICGAMRARGIRTQPFKKGPDYIDPLWLTAASGRSCRNLDFYTMGEEEIRQEFARHMAGADLGLVEGNKGLFDGMDLTGRDSNAGLAALLGAPVVLVIDTGGMTRGIAPLLLGYQRFDPRIRIAGVILNKVGGQRHEGKLRETVEHYTDLPVLGAVHRSSELQIDERHLGLIPSNEARHAEGKIASLARVVAAQVDLDRLVAIAAAAPAVPEAGPAPARAPSELRIGYPHDRAFGFYYPGDLEALEANGAELVPFDTLRDRRLPEVDGLFLGGGFPETVMEQLEANVEMRSQIRGFIESGGPAYAECGGLMYLCRALTWEDRSCEMVGVIPAAAVMRQRPQGRGYVKLRETSQAPWPLLSGQDRARVIHGHEFHYSTLEELHGRPVYAYQVLRGSGIDGRHDGLVYKNLLACYAHLRDVGGHHWTKRFIEHVRRCRESPSGGISVCGSSAGRV